ncbi:MAG: tripartite tricarboxylate transporter substrate binding protein [Rhodospirillales bacterium]
MKFRNFAGRSIAMGLGAVAVAALAAPTAAKAEYPEKPITVMVGFAAGGGVDTYARTVAGLIQDHIGQPMVVVNKPGAAGMIAARATVDAEPDGYTLYVTNTGSLLAKAMMDGEKSKLDPITDLTPIAGIGQLVTALVVQEDSPFKSAADVVKAARENPGSLKWAHPGRGSLHMIGGAAFLAANRIKARDIPFKGGSTARNAIVGGQVDFGFVGIQLLSGFEGKLRALGVTIDERDPVNNDVPTFSEQGLEGIDISGLMMMLGHPDIPQDVRAKLSDATAKVIASQEFKDLAAKAGISAFFFDAETAATRLKKLKTNLEPVIAEIKNQK